MISNYLIGLREGLEAALVVSILLTYLVRTNRVNNIKYVWIGIYSAVAFSVAFASLLSFTSLNVIVTEEGQETFAGIMSLIAVGFVTWMIIWMRNSGKKMNAELEGKLETAVKAGALTVSVMAFAAVAREGLETALFFFSAAQAVGSTIEPLIGLALGITTSVVIGYLLYRRAVKINLRRFFNVTSYFLILVAAGVFSYGLHELEEAHVIPTSFGTAFDLSATVSVDSWFGTLAKGIFNFNPQTSWLEAIGWTAYVIFAVWLYNRKPAGSTTKVSVPLKEKEAVLSK
ncbi:MAG: FTR1 family protein [Rhodoluna sp.]|nr:FTR1 family protein [Rhodoluna sp.]